MHQVGNYKVLCFGKIGYVKIYFSVILKLDRHRTSFQYWNQVHKFQSKQEMCDHSIFLLYLSLPFLKDVYMKWKFVKFVSHKKSQGKNDKNYTRFIQTLTV